MNSFEEFLLESASGASEHFSKAKKHAENSLEWHKSNARGHAMLSHHFDKKGDSKKAAYHSDVSEKHIKKAQEIEDRS